jgi:hypothetical protein
MDPVRLWKIVEDKHRVHSTSEVAAIVKLEARNQLKNLKQGAFKSIITYKKRYNDALKAYHDHGIPPKDGAEQGWTSLMDWTMAGTLISKSSISMAYR